MTTIAFRFGVLAADTRETCQTEAAGEYFVETQKLFRKVLGTGKRKRTVWIATAGNTSPGLAFVEWYGSRKRLPPKLRTAGDAEGGGFTALVLDGDELMELSENMQPEKIVAECYAIGSGAKAAIAVMLHDPRCTAAQAVAAAARVDPYTGGKIVTSKG